MNSNLQNRIDPWGKLHAASARGAWMGNRGILHDENKQIVRPWQHNGWVTCRLDYEANIRTGATGWDKLFTPGNYSELFFLDEATAFAAGHRPCAQCRNRRYREFKATWVAANREFVEPDDPAIKEIDKVLQSERTFGMEKMTFDAELGLLPNGTIIDLKGAAYLVWRGQLYAWSFAGYEAVKTKTQPSTVVCVLTPPSIVRMFAKGFVPQVHNSAFN